MDRRNGDEERLTGSVPRPAMPSEDRRTDEILRVPRSELPDRVVDQEDACGRSSCT